MKKLSERRRAIALKPHFKTNIYVYMRKEKCPKCTEYMIAPAELCIYSDAIVVSVIGESGCDNCDKKFEETILDKCIPNADVLWSALCGTESLDTMAHVFANCAEKITKPKLISEFKKYMRNSEG